MRRELPLRAGQTVTYSSVVGVPPGGRSVSGFLNYASSVAPALIASFALQTFSGMTLALIICMTRFVDVINSRSAT